MPWSFSEISFQTTRETSLNIILSVHTWVRTVRDRYFLYVYGQFEAYTNSVRGEAELRGRIQFLHDEDHDVELRVFYGDDITSQFIEKDEKMMGYYYRREERIRKLANMNLCDRFSTCYNCTRKVCPVREDAEFRLSEGTKI